jgi:cob(I)alamin adenosyltransferase
MLLAFKGYVQVYTGDGKGKTTAAIGLAIRALGAGKKVMFLQFMKTKVYSEHKMLSTISANLTLETVGKPFFVIKEGSMPAEELAKWKEKAVIFSPGQPPKEYLELAAQGMARAREVITGETYDVVILDEINVVLNFGLVTWDEVKDLLEHKGDNVEVVLTGRGAPPELIERADLVTEMREIKHYYQQGVEARKGIEN